VDTMVPSVYCCCDIREIVDTMVQLCIVVYRCCDIREIVDTMVQAVYCCVSLL